MQRFVQFIGSIFASMFGTRQSTETDLSSLRQMVGDSPDRTDVQRIITGLTFTCTDVQVFEALVQYVGWKLFPDLTSVLRDHRSFIVATATQNRPAEDTMFAFKAAVNRLLPWAPAEVCYHSSRGGQTIDSTIGIKLPGNLSLLIACRDMRDKGGGIYKIEVTASVPSEPMAAKMRNIVTNLGGDIRKQKQEVEIDKGKAAVEFSFSKEASAA